MTIKRILIARHGKKDENGNLIPETIPILYKNGQDTLGAIALANRNVRDIAFGLHSGKTRTIATLQAILAGTYGLPIPKTQDELLALNTGVETLRHPALDYSDLKINMDFYKKVGDTEYIERLMANPDSEELEGKPVTSWSQMMKTGRQCLLEAIDQTGRKSIGVLATHCPIAEPMLIAAINSGRKVPIRRLSDIGGIVPMEGYSILQTNSGKGYTTASLEKAGQIFPVDLSQI